MNNSDIAFAPKAFMSKEDLVKPSTKDADAGFDKLTDDQLLLIGGGDVVVCW